MNEIDLFKSYKGYNSFICRKLYSDGEEIKASFLCQLNDVIINYPLRDRCAYYREPFLNTEQYPIEEREEKRLNYIRKYLELCYSLKFKEDNRWI